jgi:mono/diheme cytochrome c family protein
MKRRFTFLAAVGLALASVWFSGNASAQLKVLPGSAARGEQLLVEKGCANCHSLDGRGGNGAPDLTRTPPHASAPGLLASAMWNHAPIMGEQKAELTSAEAADLFAYMYSALYFAPAGDVTRGKGVFQKKHCADCHSETPVASAPGRPISAWTAVKDPIAWAGHMWNHSSDMSAAMRSKGFVPPKLSSQDVADLMIYLRSLPALRSRSATFGMGEPEQGRLVFERSCESCHSFGAGIGKRIDLLQRGAPQTVTGYIAAMWNHAELMRAMSGANASPTGRSRQETIGRQFPKLDPEGMSNLVAFLFSESYFFERGNAARGRGVFESKSCARCHEEHRKETGAPDLSQSAELYSPITLTSAVWRHTPAMFATARRAGLSWPRFQGSEMADVIAYLNSRVLVRIAAPAPK